MSISSDVHAHPDATVDRSRPTKISHVVLNSATTDNQVNYFIDVLGFRLSDSSHMMEFLRCSSDHHSMAIFRNKGPSLNHVAYEMPNIDGLMRGAGRMKENGFNIEWGVGRHGPGNNVFSYFIEPNGFVTEYTAEVEQVDDADHVPQPAEYWHKIAPIPDRWRTAGPPGPKMRKAMAGDFIGLDPADMRCEDSSPRRFTNEPAVEPSAATLTTEQTSLSSAGRRSRPHPGPLRIWIHSPAVAAGWRDSAPS